MSKETSLRILEAADALATLISEDAAQRDEEDSCVFEMIQLHDLKLSRRQGPESSQPLGRIVYTVTVTGKYVPFDNE